MSRRFVLAVSFGVAAILGMAPDSVYAPPGGVGGGPDGLEPVELVLEVESIPSEEPVHVDCWVCLWRCYLRCYCDPLTGECWCEIVCTCPDECAFCCAVDELRFPISPVGPDGDEGDVPEEREEPVDAVGLKLCGKCDCGADDADLAESCVLEDTVLVPAYDSCPEPYIDATKCPAAEGDGAFTWIASDSTRMVLTPEAQDVVFDTYIAGSDCSSREPDSTKEGT